MFKKTYIKEWAMKYFILITIFFPFSINAENEFPSSGLIETIEILNGNKEVEGVEIIVIEKSAYELEAQQQKAMEREQKLYLEHLQYMEQDKTEKQLITERLKALTNKND
jgi:hypothetical protein